MHTHKHLTYIYIIDISVVKDDMEFSSSQQPYQIYGTTEFPVLWEKMEVVLLLAASLTKVFGKGDATDPHFHQQPSAWRVPADLHVYFP